MMIRVTAVTSNLKALRAVQVTTCSGRGHIVAATLQVALPLVSIVKLLS